MNAKIKLLSLFLLTMVLAAPSALAADISLGQWQADGYQLWRTSFPLSVNAEKRNGASELFYPQSGTYITGSYQNSLSPTDKLKIELGVMASINSATGSDSDWNYSDRPNEVWMYGTFKTSSDSFFINVDRQKALTADTAWFYGYGLRRNKFVMTGGLYTVWEYQPEYMPLENLNSTYTMIYHGPHVGLVHQKQLSPRYTMMTSLTYTPMAYAQGQGWWNLRSLRFNHTGPAQMFDGVISLCFTPHDANSGNITVGYRYQRMSLFKSGQEDLNPDISLDKAENIQKGMFITGQFAF